MATAGSLQVLQIGVGWLIVAELGGGAGDLGLIAGSVAMPGILMALFGGILADRADRRMLLMVISGANAVLMTLLAIVVVTGVVEIWQIALIAVGQGLLGGLDGPVRAAYFPQLVERKHMASTLSQYIYE